MVESINLLDVTLFTADCINPQLALESLLISSEKINFGKVILFSDTKPYLLPKFVEYIKIPKIKSLIEYSNFMLVDLNKFITTNFCLNVHADGFIHNPHLWNNEFKNWDYIGAPWPLNLHFVDEKTRVGNGGVSFRSKKLLQETSKYGYVNMHEDHFICQTIRDNLKSKNIRIAPLKLAKIFSFELECDDLKINPKIDCFAFHGKTYTQFHIDQNNFLKQKMENRIKNMNIIEKKYIEKCNTTSDINEHLPALYFYAQQCKTIAEMGVRYVTSSYAFALSKPEKLLCLDIDKNHYVEVFIDECKQENINIEFVHASSLEHELDQEYDLLFIDTLHTFEQLSKELEKHHSKIKKYIIFHDTIFWGNKNENPIDSSDTGERGKNVGLVPAIKNFLKSHKEWKEVCTYSNNNGLTVLRNINENPYLVYKDILVGQTPSTPKMLKQLIEDNNFSVIIEIGTHRGGLSLWLNDNKSANCEFYTFDIEPNHLKINPEKENINFIKGDCFTDQFETIKKLIQNNGQVLLLCDGGNKEKEFSTFAPFIKSNDVIMCHDFADNHEDYNFIKEQIGWPSNAESSITNLITSIQNNNMKPYFYNEAKRCFWGCFKKI